MFGSTAHALEHFQSLFCDFIQELGDRCTLFLQTKLVSNPRELQTRAVAKNAPSMLQLYLRSWSGWVQHAYHLGFDPADPPPAALPQFATYALPPEWQPLLLKL